MLFKVTLPDNTVHTVSRREAIDEIATKICERSQWPIRGNCWYDIAHNWRHPIPKLIEHIRITRNAVKVELV
jgi:hypothetical protein